MAYSDNFPATRPVFQADFANGGRIDPRATFSRADTPPTYAAPSAVHFWSNEKHLSSENIVLQSSTFNLAWSRQGLALPTGGQADPAGGTDGFTLVEDSATNFHRVYQNVTADGKPALTVYAKQNSGSRYLLLTLWNATNDWECAVFDLAGSAPATASGASSTFTGVTATQTASGGGYYKCVLTGTGTANDWFISLNDASTTSGINANYGVKSYAGDGSSSIDVAFASLSTTGATDYNATTTQISRSYAPTLKSVSYAGQPRFEYDPSSDGQSVAKGILIEGQATNLYGNSLDMTGVAGTRTNIDSNVAVGPTGELTADALRLNDSDSSTHYREYSFTGAASTTYTFSVYLKAAGLSHAAIRSNNLFSTDYVYFNLSNGAVEGSPSMSNSMTSVGNGWYRCSVTATTTGSGAASFVIYITDSAASTIVATGDSYRAILGQAIQIESGSHPSSFIETSGGSTATRALESLSVDLSALGIGNEVTAVGEAISTAVTSNRETVIQLSPSGSNDVALYAGRNVGGGVSSQFYAGGGAVYLGGGSVTAGSAYKFAAREAPANHALCLNGGTVATNTSAVDSTTIGTLHIGSRSDGSNNIYGHCKRIAIYNEALSDSNLQAITS